MEIQVGNKNEEYDLPRMAKRLDEKTMKGSRVTPKTAGIESTWKQDTKLSPITTHLFLGIYTCKMDKGQRELTANAISLSSITATVRSKGVACQNVWHLLEINLTINLLNHWPPSFSAIKDAICWFREKKISQLLNLSASSMLNPTRLTFHTPFWSVKNRFPS